ncbi:hypothetical protein AB0217_17275 [Klebsiella pneumoniae]
MKGQETRGFQSEVKQLLHLMIHSLYSIDGRLLFAKLNMLWWLYWSSIAAIDPDFAEVM